jgi:hypothetical protein
LTEKRLHLITSTLMRPCGVDVIALMGTCSVLCCLKLSIFLKIR